MNSRDTVKNSLDPSLLTVETPSFVFKTICVQTLWNFAHWNCKYKWRLMQTEHCKDFWPIWDYLVEIWLCVFFCFFEFTEQTCSGDASFPSPQEKITQIYSWVIDSKQQRAEMRASGLEELQMVLHFNRNACKKKIWQFECSFCSGS